LSKSDPGKTTLAISHIYIFYFALFFKPFP
jgi:hypothetical protein